MLCVYIADVVVVVVVDVRNVAEQLQLSGCHWRG